MLQLLGSYMQRSLVPEIMDDLTKPEELWERYHRQIGLIHRFLGNHTAVLDALRRGPGRIQRVLDIGCGNGELLDAIRRRLGVEVIGIDRRAPKLNAFDVPILEGDATRDPLPKAGVAVCVTVAHHLSEADLAALIRNAGLSVRRLIIVDLVRHWLPLVLFRIFLYPFLDRTVAMDGVQSLRRAYTPAELRAIVEHAVAGSFARFKQTVTPLRSRQMIDISWS